VVNRSILHCWDFPYFVQPGFFGVGVYPIFMPIADEPALERVDRTGPIDVTSLVAGVGVY